MIAESGDAGAKREEGTTPAELAAAYEAIVALGDSGELGEHAARMRQEFQRRTGVFGPEDPWFEARARAFWDDAVTTQGFGRLASARLAPRVRTIAERLARAHRGFFLVDDSDERGASLIDVWSGAELIVRHLDETQALTLEHADGPMDGRVAAGASGSDLFLLPGAYFHAPDALEPATKVLIEARKRRLSTQQALDTLLRMDLVLRSSSRVKAGFAYRLQGLPGGA